MRGFLGLCLLVAAVVQAAGAAAAPALDASAAARDAPSQRLEALALLHEFAAVAEVLAQVQVSELSAQEVLQARLADLEARIAQLTPPRSSLDAAAAREAAAAVAVAVSDLTRASQPRSALGRAGAGLARALTLVSSGQTAVTLCCCTGCLLLALRSTVVVHFGSGIPSPALQTLTRTFNRSEAPPSAHAQVNIAWAAGCMLVAVAVVSLVGTYAVALAMLVPLPGERAHDGTDCAGLPGRPVPAVSGTGSGSCCASPPFSTFPKLSN